jgi:hypothetical protein
MQRRTGPTCGSLVATSPEELLMPARRQGAPLPSCMEGDSALRGEPAHVGAWCPGRATPGDRPLCGPR